MAVKEKERICLEQGYCSSCGKLRTLDCGSGMCFWCTLRCKD